MDSIPGLGRPYMLQCTTEPMLWSPGTTTSEPRSQTTEAHVPQSPCSDSRGATTMRSHKKEQPHSLQLEK